MRSMHGCRAGMRRVAMWVLAILPCPVGAQEQADEGWIALFDGKSLRGWRANENQTSFWVDQGAIVAHGERSHLFYEGEVNGGTFTDFELEAEILTRAGSNSGIYFHTRFQDEGWLSQGHEAQVNCTQSDEIKTGSLYNVVKVNPSPSDDDRWFRMRIRVLGRRISIFVDDKKTVDYLEPKNGSGGRRLSSGTFALQAHDPQSEVHFRSIHVRALADGDQRLTRSDLVSVRRHRADWWQRMDYGPFLTSVVDVTKDRCVYKGISLELTPEREAVLTFDTDLLSAAGGGDGGLVFAGTPFDGSHGVQPHFERRPWFVNRVAQGASHDRNHHDQRAIAHGPIPRHRGRYLGLYRHGDRVVLSYQVGEARVLELPAFEESEGYRAITRSLHLEKATHSLSFALCDTGNGRCEIDPSGQLAVCWPGSALPPAGVDQVAVVVDRTTGDWSSLAMGTALSSDALDSARNPKASVAFVDGFAPPHPKSGAAEGLLPRMNDGALPQNDDEPERVSFFDGATGRLLIDLGEARVIHRINTYSWHKSDRAPQKFRCFGARSDAADPGSKELPSADWMLIAEVDSFALGEGGKHGSCIFNPGGSVGSYRRLLLELPANAASQGTFVGEIDVLAGDDPLAPLQEPQSSPDRRPLAVALAGAPAEARIVEVDNAVRLEVPQTALPCTLKVLLTREIEKPSPADFEDIPAPADLPSLTRGGPALWPEVVTVFGVEDQSQEPYVVDDIPIPFENPWDASMRIGGFDFFADGARAAVCTWNGDVWIVSGLGAELREIQWKRYAAGLFEPLGLKIVDEAVYVNGRDQITRLRDLNGDDEADFYECFNNDVCTTRNFHEFSFDLQTDREGNFYFSKGGPVRPGGRGFEKIVPHHGTVMKLSRDGSTLEVYSTGMRAPNGIGVSPDGQVTAGDNEGTWVPHCKLHWLEPGSFQGVIDTAQRSERPDRYNRPLCWFPMSVDNSGGSQVWVTSARWGPFQGELLHLSYGQSSIYKVMKEEVDGQVQGGVFRLPVALGSSAMRGRFNPRDGQLYVSGLRGWQTNAARLSAFQRIRHTGTPVRMPAQLSVHPEGIVIEFTCALDKKLACDVQSYALEQWNYVWGPMYGSPEVSVRNPDPEFLKTALGSEQHQYKQHDKLEILGVRLLDEKTVLLEVADLRPAMQTHLKVDLESADGAEMFFEIHHTIHQLGLPLRLEPPRPSGGIPRP